MRKTKSKIISGILSAVLILSSLPVTVLADENTEETTVPTIESEIIYSEPTTEVVDVSFEETETEPTDENVTSIPEDEAGSSQVDLDEDIDPLIDETTEPSETEETNETSETTEAPVEPIVFDHYYTEIDETVIVFHAFSIYYMIRFHL